MSAPIRSLHVLGGLERGGAETWIVQVAERVDRSRVVVDLLPQSEREGDYEARALAAGAAVHRCPPPTDGLRYLTRLREVIAGPPRYDVVHCHLHHWSGVVLTLARAAGVPVRIAHSHSGLFTDRRRAGLAMAAYYAAMKPVVRRSMTHGLAVCGAAGRALFGRHWPVDPRLVACGVCGIDLEEFEVDVDGLALRAELGLPADALVVGHVGRFGPFKNHPFLVEIAAELVRADPRVHLVLVGEGAGRRDIERRVSDAGLSGRVHFAGLRRDVVRLFVGVLDVCVLPSLWEGLPRVANEAQAAGKPIVVAEHLADEIEVLPSLVRRLALEAGAEAWARAILDCEGRGVATADALAAMRGTPIDVDRNARDLVDFYEGALGGAGALPVPHAELRRRPAREPAA